MIGSIMTFLGKLWMIVSDADIGKVPLNSLGDNWIFSSMRSAAINHQKHGVHGYYNGKQGGSSKQNSLIHTKLW